MPLSMSLNMQSVKVKDTVYVGGGMACCSEESNKVMALDLVSNKWDTLRSYCATDFGMACINNKLVLIGGSSRHEGRIPHLGVWKARTKRWTRPYPPMLIPRSECSAITYKQWLIVAGGVEDNSSAAVEMFDTENEQWHSDLPSPVAFCCMKSAIVGDTWYLLGGYLNSIEETTRVYSASLEALVSHATSERSDRSFHETIWSKKASTELFYPSPVSIEGSLFCLGGGYYKSCGDFYTFKKYPRSTISVYVYESNEWLEVGKLPTTLLYGTSMVIADKLYYFGGSDGLTSPLVYYSYITKE